MTDDELTYIKTMLEESESCRVLTDQQLSAYYTKAGSADGAIYLGALAKAEVNNITLPDGTSLPNNREYWLAIAAAFRPNKGGPLRRADGR